MAELSRVEDGRNVVKARRTGASPVRNPFRFLSAGRRGRLSAGRRSRSLRSVLIGAIVLACLLVPIGPASAQLDARERPRVRGPLAFVSKRCEQRVDRARGQDHRDLPFLLPLPRFRSRPREQLQPKLRRFVDAIERERTEEMVRHRGQVDHQVPWPRSGSRRRPRGPGRIPTSPRSGPAARRQRHRQPRDDPKCLQALPQGVAHAKNKRGNGVPSRLEGQHPTGPRLRAGRGAFVGRGLRATESQLPTRLFVEASLGELLTYFEDVLASPITACAAASRATGTRNGEQDT